ncbi:MAG: hypothetical protein M3R15_30300, partial [Acidobacteriota bacterium]|nr:hypothetical protein [Acidobacteriota bacterium]
MQGLPLAMLCARQVKRGVVRLRLITEVYRSHPIGDMEILVKLDCPFCNFLDREVLIYEDELAFAIISLRPINKHHVMVI